MKKQLGLLTSLLFLCASVFVWAGCSDRCCNTPCERPCAPVCEPSCRPVCPPACKPVCPEPCKPVCPAPACKPACPPPACRPVCPPPCEPVCPPPCEPMCKVLKPCKHGNRAELCCVDGLTVTARNPNTCMLGDQYPLEFDIKACDDLCDVEVTTYLPEGVTFVRSQPEARVEGRKLIWSIGHMDKGQCIPAKVWLKCECEGELCACFCAKAVPVRFCALLCAKPTLECHKCGPEQVCPGDPVNYTITVSNSGSCAAEDVVVTDQIPDGFEHRSCLRTLTYKLGCLAPCESKTINICLTAVKRGKWTNRALVTACNADSTSCQATTCVCCCGVDIAKVGPKEVAIGKNADYQITVTNTGDLPLTDIVVTDQAPSQTSIVSANGATINGNRAIWRLREMKPGEKVSFALTLTTCTPGCFTNYVNVVTCQGCNACAEFTTRWKGRPALNMCVDQTENPICIGETTTYNVSIVNQGSESDSNVQLVVRFPKELVPQAASGDTPGTVSGQTVTFAPVQNLNPRQVLRYRVDAKAVSSGDARTSFEITSDNIKTPITEQESTIVN